MAIYNKTIIDFQGGSYGGKIDPKKQYWPQCHLGHIGFSGQYHTKSTIQKVQNSIILYLKEYQLH